MSVIGLILISIVKVIISYFASIAPGRRKMNLMPGIVISIGIVGVRDAS